VASNPWKTVGFCRESADVVIERFVRYVTERGVPNDVCGRGGRRRGEGALRAAAAKNADVGDAVMPGGFRSG
jgi:hypothetical protein